MELLVLQRKGFCLKVNILRGRNVYKRQAASELVACAFRVLERIYLDKEMYTE